MAYAFLKNSKSGSEIRVANSLIEQYRATTGSIDVNTFVDFLNKTSYDVGLNYNLYNATSAGLTSSCYEDQTMNKDHTNITVDYYYNNNHMKTFENCVYVLDEETVLLFICYKEDHSSRVNHVVMFTVKDGVVTCNKAQAFTGNGGGLCATKLTDTRFIVASGGFRDSTNNGYVLHLQTLDIDLKNKTFTINSPVSTGRYYYVQLSRIFKISESAAVVFFADGNGGRNYYNACYPMTIAENGTITLGGLRLDHVYHQHSANYFYDVHQIADNKFVEITHYNYPLVTIITVNNNTASRSGYIALSSSTAYVERGRIYNTFAKGNYVFVPYFNGGTWNICSVDCSGSLPIERNHSALAINSADWPIIKQVSDDQIVSIQRNANVAYASITKFDEYGNLNTSSCVLTVDFRIENIYKFVQTGEKQGYVVCRTFNQTYGFVVIPLIWEGSDIMCGEPQIWNESNVYDNSYTFFKNIGDGYSICIYQPYMYNYYNGINCFTIFQNGLELHRSDIVCVQKDDIYPTTNRRMICDIVVDSEKKEIALLFRDFMNGSTSYYDLYFTHIAIKGNRPYVAKSQLIRQNTDVANRVYNFTRLIRVNENDYLVVYDNTNDYLSACQVTVKRDMRVIPADDTGIIAGLTQTQATKDIPGNILLLDA